MRGSSSTTYTKYKSRVVKKELHRLMVELLPSCRLVLGPTLSGKRSYSIKDMLLDFNINCFVNLTPNPRGSRSRWYMNQDTGMLIEDLREQCGNPDGPIVKCINFPMEIDTPTKDNKLFNFITKLAQMLRKDPEIRMYINDATGSHVAASVALPLLYFMKPPAEKNDMDVIKDMKRRGKHQVIPDRKKAYVQQIYHLCKMDDKSMHRHVFFAPQKNEKKKRTQKEENVPKKKKARVTPPEALVIDSPTLQEGLTEEHIQNRPSTFSF